MPSQIFYKLTLLLFFLEIFKSLQNLLAVSKQLSQTVLGLRPNAFDFDFDFVVNQL